MDYLVYRWTSHDITILYHIIGIDLVYHELFRAEVGMGGIMHIKSCLIPVSENPLE